MEAFIEHQKVSLPDWKHWSWDETRVVRKPRKKKLTKAEQRDEELIDEIASRY